jgi:hypothetical protein
MEAAKKAGGGCDEAHHATMLQRLHLLLENLPHALMWHEVVAWRLEKPPTTTRPPMSLQQQQLWKLDKPRSSVLRHIAVL